MEYFNIFLLMSLVGLYLVVRLGFSMDRGFIYLTFRYVFAFLLGELYLCFGSVLYLISLQLN